MVEIEVLSVSDTSSSVSFDSGTNLIKIKNVGTSSCYFNLNAAAATSHFKLEPEDEIEIGLETISTLQAICDSGETTTLQSSGTELW